MVTRINRLPVKTLSQYRVPRSSSDGSRNGSWRTFLISSVSWKFPVTSMLLSSIFLKCRFIHARRQGKGNAHAIKNSFADTLSLASISEPQKRNRMRGMMKTTMNAIIRYCLHCQHSMLPSTKRCQSFPIGTQCMSLRVVSASLSYPGNSVSKATARYNFSDGCEMYRNLLAAL